MKKIALALNAGSLVRSKIFVGKAVPQTAFCLNGDIIAASSLFSQPLKGDFRINLSKAACFIIQKAQSALLSSCRKDMEKRIKTQKKI